MLFTMSLIVVYIICNWRILTDINGIMNDVKDQISFQAITTTQEKPSKRTALLKWNKH